MQTPVLFPLIRNINTINTVTNTGFLACGEPCLDIVDALHTPVMRAVLCDGHSLRTASSEYCQEIY
jgi:hypothetical protein